MDLQTPLTAADLAQRLGAPWRGDGTLLITGINEIHHVRVGDLSFVDPPRYYGPALASAASVILIDQDRECPPGKALIIVAQPFAVYNQLVWEERPAVAWQQSIDPSASVGPGTTVAPGATIGPGARIGQDCYIGPNATIGEGVTLGDRVSIGAGAVIGEEAFYFKRTPEGLIPWRSGGTVVLEDDVAIGANCNIARGVSSATTIGKGTKIDALVQIGHDCRIGQHCILAAQVGVAGNTTIGDWCVLQGQVGVAQNLRIGDRAILLAQSGIGKDLEGGQEYFGSPAQEAWPAFRELALLRGLRKGK